MERLEKAFKGGAAGDGWSVAEELLLMPAPDRHPGGTLADAEAILDSITTRTKAYIDAFSLLSRAITKSVPQIPNNPSGAIATLEFAMEEAAARVGEGGESAGLTLIGDAKSIAHQRMIDAAQMQDVAAHTDENGDEG
jgi:hypothetical protein